MPSPLQQQLDQATVKIAYKMGTGCFVSPGIGITCAHVIPDNLIVGSVFKAELYNGERIDCELLFLHRDDDIDLCVFRMVQYRASCYIVLGDECAPGDEIFGHGYPVLDNTQRADGFDGRYESHLYAGDRVAYPFGLHKIRGTQILGGFSGSASVNIRTGRFIGIVTQTRGDRQALGGYLIPASLILDKLNTYTDFKANNNRPMAEKWRSLCLGKSSGLGAQATRAVYLRQFDEAYRCDRRIFSEYFDDILALDKTGCQHFLIIGEKQHSPLGLAKKLIFEFFTSFGADDFNYPDKPDRVHIDPVESGPSTNASLLVKALFTKFYNKSADRDLPVWKMQIADYYNFLVQQFELKPLTFLPISVAIGSSGDDLSTLFRVIREFSAEIESRAASRTPKTPFHVLFFWCVHHPAGMNLTNQLTRRFLGALTPLKLPARPLLGFLNPGSEGRRLRTFLLDIDQKELFIKPINQFEALTRPPSADIEDWMANIDEDGGADYQVPGKIRSKIEQEQSTELIERYFKNIIMEFNNAKSQDYD
jgi:hypothetical protein